MTVPTALILRAIDAGHIHGFDIMEVTGLPSGTVYPALRRLERGGHLTSSWEDARAALEEGRPRRRRYAMTNTGRALLEPARAKLAALGGFARPAPAGPDR